jgi:hypothetical protein
MTVSLKHTFQSAKTDSADVTLVQPSNWNEEHELELATNKLLGRATAGTGAAEEIAIGTALSVSGGTLAVTTVPVANGGTGAATLTGVVKGNGTSPMTAGTVSLTTEVSGTLPVANGGTGAATLAANNVLIGNGTSAVTAVAPGTSGNVLVSNGTSWTSGIAPANPSLDAIATGSLADGSTVVINVDGTVSVVAGEAQVFGSPTTTGIASANYISSTYDANAQKVVLAYQNGVGYAIVGTVSGTSITFGTPVIFNALRTDDTAIAYHEVAQKVVIAYQDYSGGTQIGYAKVGTVSGTTITFGAAATFNNQRTEQLSAAYDASTQKVVIGFQDITGSVYPTAIVGTVSGTSISFGTKTVVQSAACTPTRMVYDITQQKIVMAWGSNAGAGGRAAVGTVSGTSISFGTVAEFQTNVATIGTDDISIAYDADAQKTVIAWTSTATSSFGAAIVGTVSGTTISFGTRVIFTSTIIAGIAAAYNSVAKKIVISFQDQGNSSFGTAIVGKVSGTSISFEPKIAYTTAAITQHASATYDTVAQRVVLATTGPFSLTVMQTGFSNMTTENFIGFSNGAYTNGQTATIQIVGAVDDAQSGLTAGQSYFVQNNGSLGLTAGNTSVFAGTAVAATKIIVKG